MPDGPGTIDFARSRAILVGTGTYTHGFGNEPMLAAANSMAAMHTALTWRCGWPASRITVFIDQSTRDGVPGRIADLVHETEDVLLFYYVGHGQLLIGNDLGLALTDTSEDHRKRLSTSLKLSELHRELEHNCDARIKILILDCCLSGIATKYAQGPGDLADLVHQSAMPVGNGTYVWTACGHSQETYFEPGPNGLTYFTRLLTATLNQGIEGAGRYLTIADLHQEVTRRLRRTTIPGAEITPEPTLRFTGSTDRFHLAPNRAREPERGHAPAAARPEPADQDAGGKGTARWAGDPPGSRPRTGSDAAAGNNQTAARLVAALQDLGGPLVDADPQRARLARELLDEIAQEGDTPLAVLARSYLLNEASNARPTRSPAPSPLHVFWLIDCSASMGVNDKMGELNFAIREAIPEFCDAADSNPAASIYMRVIGFSDGAIWSQATPVLVHDYTYSDLHPFGRSDLGAAFRLVAKELRIPPMPKRAMRPLIVLVSGSEPTDNWRSCLDELNSAPWGARAARVAVAVGRDADYNVLRAFLGNPEAEPISAGNPKSVAAALRYIEMDAAENDSYDLW